MTRRALAPTLLALALAGCAADGDPPKSDHAPEVSMWGGVTRAVAVIHPTQGNDVRGTVHFYQEPDGVRVEAHLEGLEPGPHGFHIHEFGDCTAPDATSAGGHYDPEGHEHAGPGVPQRHAGDLGNIVAAEDGTAHYEETVQNISVSGIANPIIGRGVIVHAGEDDLQTQPTGGAGGRVGCGVIGIAQQ